MTQKIDLNLFINQDFVHPTSKKNKYICSKKEKNSISEDYSNTSS